MRARRFGVCTLALLAAEMTGRPQAGRLRVIELLFPVPSDRTSGQTFRSNSPIKPNTMR